ncbi:MFS transporter [Asanoa sp. WMMD1127]|uniref:MFS transporter n=1 Tax=Asanoa sp. WMMD1127 TaxID=3016107 RepID=UPI0024181085|nr:MFS transporter [Asanoa sp. WMMD1127]MDG4821411.1 MFS transporter [Asanoa sp. WMMD1127]
MSRRAAFAGSAAAFAVLFVAAGAPTPLLVDLADRWAFAPWLVTFAFGVYAFAVLAALLLVGSLSDHVGRRPVLLGALTVQLAAMLMFVFATDIWWVCAARVVQGVGTGAATSAFTASIVELAPPRHRRAGAIVGAVAPPVGLGVGALLTGVAVEHSGNPTRLAFVVLAGLTVASIALVARSPETVARRPGARRSLVPHVRVPPRIRPEFAAVTPVLVASWALAALFLGLAPTIVRGVFANDDGVVHGAVVAVALAAAAVTATVLGRRTARATQTIGAAFVLVGAALLAAAAWADLFPLLWVAGAVCGVGLGPSFSGALRALSPLAAERERAGLFAAVYLVSYVSFGLPAILAGELIGPVGLLPVTVGYAALVAAAGLVALVAQARLGARPALAR